MEPDMEDSPDPEVEFKSPETAPFKRKPWSIKNVSEKADAIDPTNTNSKGNKESCEDHLEENHSEENVEKQIIILDEPSVILEANKSGKEMDENHSGRVPTNIKHLQTDMEPEHLKLKVLEEKLQWTKIRKNADK